MSVIQSLKTRQKEIYEYHTRLQLEQNELLEEIMEIRQSMRKSQTEVNEIQIALEKLEQST